MKGVNVLIFMYLQAALLVKDGIISNNSKAFLKGKFLRWRILLLDVVMVFYAVV